MVGIYCDDCLIENLSSDKKVGDFLIEVFDEILSKYEIQEIIYANGPGSFMGIKLAYVILKTICIVKECKMYCVSGFELNRQKPIRANKNISFVLKNNEILLQKAKPGEFTLPLNLSDLNKSDDILPNYFIAAV